jgi:cellulose synthase/poly-beta-1,6-N-acetylglucosamine synthase-like glycosyltransferase
MENNGEEKKIEIEQESIGHLNTIRKWSMFMSVLGFIMLGLLVIIGLIAGTFLTAFNGGGRGAGLPESIIIIFFLLIAVIYFFPILFLFRFSKHTASAVETLSKEELYKAIKNLKSYFVYLGVLIIVGLSFYLIAIVAAGASMSFLKGIG